MEIKGTEKQIKFAKDILNDFNLLEIIRRSKKKTFEETSYKKIESYNRAQESVNKLSNLEIDASFIIENKDQHNVSTLITAIDKKYNIEDDFFRLINTIVKELENEKYS